MSKNITIQEGGIGVQLTADKLKTNLTGSGTCQWIPEDESTLGTKTITEDGTYNASDDGYYGYSQVTVSGIGKATGTDGDGDEATAETTPGGDLEVNKIPTTIRVETPPTVTTYADGATIDFTGIVVKGYLKTGGLWTDSDHPNGVIPISELIFPVTTADAGGQGGEWTDGDGINARWISEKYTEDTDVSGNPYSLFVDGPVGEHNGEPAYIGNKDNPTHFFITKYGSKYYVFESTNNVGVRGYSYNADRPNQKYIHFASTSYTTGTGEVVEWDAAMFDWITDVPESTKVPTGTPQMQPVSVPQEIPVQYTRRDGNTLETSFEISVTA